MALFICSLYLVLVCVSPFNKREVILFYFTSQQELAKSSALSGCPAPNFSGCIQLGACGENEILPMNPDLPADLFTACLTTPIRIALKWFIIHNKDKLIPKVLPDMIDK